MSLKSSPGDGVRVIRAAARGPELAIVEQGGSARAIVWPGNGARHRSLHLIELDSGGSTVDLCHESECVYHVSEGSGSMLDIGDDQRHEVVVGSMMFIEPGTPYRFLAGDAGATLLGGPCPADRALYEHIGG